MPEPILVERRHGATVCLSLNRPQQRNALDPELVESLTEALRRASADALVRAIVLTGEGTCFCAGADLAALKRLQDASVEENHEDCSSLKNLFKALIGSPKPVIAAVNGPALAGGCGLASCCDLILASPEATFGYPEVKVGFVAAMVLVILGRQVGERRARELLLTGRTYRAAEAERWGMVYEIIPAEKLLDEAFALAHQLAAGAPSAMGLTKELLWKTSGLSLGTALDLAADSNVLARTHPDMHEGLSAFLEKRSPSWKPK
jgi:methylglutaconyl-CoA hydratase